MRLYEARGARATGSVAFGCDVLRVFETDLLERAIDHPTALVTGAGSPVALRLRPFQIVTLRATRAALGVTS